MYKIYITVILEYSVTGYVVDLYQGCTILTTQVLPLPLQ